VVLESAYASAEAIALFRERGQLIDLAFTLATDYWEALASGQGDKAVTVPGYICVRVGR
jgi:hypothetical protein